MSISRSLSVVFFVYFFIAQIIFALIFRSWRRISVLKTYFSYLGKFLIAFLEYTSRSSNFFSRISSFGFGASPCASSNSSIVNQILFCIFLQILKSLSTSFLSYSIIKDLRYVYYLKYFPFFRCLFDYFSKSLSPRRRFRAAIRDSI